jgi:hypothetical protein
MIQNTVEPGLKGHGTGRDGGWMGHDRHTRPFTIILTPKHDVGLDHQDAVVSKRRNKLAFVVGRVSPPHVLCRDSMVAERHLC